jgi:hypothetical protein
MKKYIDDKICYCNKKGQIVKIICPNNDIYLYKYNNNGEMIKKTYPDNSYCKYIYKDNYIKKILSNGIIYHCDKNNESILKKILPTGTIINYNYKDNNIHITENYKNGDVYKCIQDYEGNIIKHSYINKKCKGNYVFVRLINSDIFYDIYINDNHKYTIIEI